MSSSSSSSTPDMSAASSYIITDIPDSAASSRHRSSTSSDDESDDDDVDSLPSISSSILDSDSTSDAQREWEESLEQLQLLLTMIVMPFAGKFLGRKFAYWSEIPHVSYQRPVETTRRAQTRKEG